MSSKSSVASRFAKGRRRDAMDEIEGWISDARSEFGRGKSTRVSAQPPKNITEQKMLDAKLFEMSKQRYNFILHAKWQQKLFMEKQRQKTAVMKDLLKNVDLGKISEQQRQKDQKPRERSRDSSPCDGLRNEYADEHVLPEFIVEREQLQKKSVTFITERANIVHELPQLPSEMETVIDAVHTANLPIDLPAIDGSVRSNKSVFSDTTSKRPQAYILPLEGRWPIKDLRFVKLSEALSDNYPIKRGRGFSSSAMSLA